jgi:lysozyme
MKTSPAGIDLIKQFEGFESKAYVCPAGVPTIGYGTTRINGKAVAMGTMITESQAVQYLTDDLEKFESAVNRLVTVDLSQNQFDALVSFVYNLGEGNFASSTLLRNVNAQQWQQAADQLLRWNRAGGQVLAGLTRRRTAERSMFLGS